eukprot:2821113-Pleurochrysis_carterae.AAC.10
MNGMLYGNGQQFTVKGVNWYGAEDRNAKIGGLDTHGLEYYFHFLQTQAPTAYQRGASTQFCLLLVHAATYSTQI